MNYTLEIQTMQSFLDKMTHKNDKQPLCLDDSFPCYLSSFDPENDELTLEYPVNAWCLNHAGTLHGGLIATAMDKTMGSIACYRSGNFTPTINLNVNYVLPVTDGDSLMVTAKASRIGGHIGAMTATATRKSDGVCVATATGNFMILRQPVTQ